jgi:uncharacterized repeat protein (TIGR03803 family)
MRDKIFFIGLRTALAILAVTFMVTCAGATDEKVIYSFDPNGRDGYQPAAGLISDAAGNLYGTTYYGGAHGGSDGGYGTVFELTFNKAGGGWTEKVLHSFNDNGKDGYAPLGSLIFDTAGNLYGTTEFGGVYASGTVFELEPRAGGKWTEKVLHSFNDKDGYAPFAGLTLDASGNLYGTTYSGGSHGWGTVFELTPKAGGGWTEKILHSFNVNGNGGTFPEAGVVLDTSGNLFGAASDVVFKLTPKAGGGWTENVLRTFKSKYGTFPYATPIFDATGNLYGTTFGGGIYSDGMVFELTPQTGGHWTEKVLHSFDGKDGNDCFAGVIFDAAGNLFGATKQGGVYDQGTVFELIPQAGGGWTEKVLHTFNDNGTDGAYPDGGVIFDTGGNLYGTASSGGAHNGGAVFEITP